MISAMPPARTLYPLLLESNGPHHGRAHELPYGIHVLGRGSEASVQVEHEDVSRRHAELIVSPDGVVVRDLESKNGVRIDGEPITGPTKVTHGQVIALGDLALTLSHPASQVADVLARAGETTMTATDPRTLERRGVGTLWLPLLGVLLFGALVTAMMLL